MDEKILPPTDHNAGSWINCWDAEISSESGINIGSSSSELNGLVEDKDIAAKAVAFVVNSTRKGVVPLCADVANLMRSKKRLEQNLSRLRRENDILHSRSVLTRNSNSISPSQNSDKSITSSVCSHCSNHVYNSSRSEKQNKSVSKSSSTESLNNHKCTTEATIERYAWDSNPTDEWKNSPPVMTSILQQHDSFKKVNSPVAQITREVQCSIFASCPDKKLSEKILECQKRNAILTEELNSAKGEIATLKSQLKNLETNQCERRRMEKVHIENECQAPREKELKTVDERSPTPSPYKQKATKRSPRSAVSPLPPEANYILGCRCVNCETLTNHGDKSIGALEKKFLVNGKQEININDHVVVKGERTGCIRYIGHLDKIGQPNMVFIGLELDAPVGRHDGYFNGKRYFNCHKDHGVFLPIQDVISIIKRKLPQKASASEGMEELEVDQAGKPSKRHAKRDKERRKLNLNALSLREKILSTDGNYVDV